VSTLSTLAIRVILEWNIPFALKTLYNACYR
jgi:hypothetical protein